MTAAATVNQTLTSATTMKRTLEASPRTTARIIGVLFLTTILTGAFAEGFVSGSLVVPGNAAKTAANVLANQSLLRAGFAVYMLEMTAQIAMVALFYDLLKPVSRNVARLSAILGLVGCGIKAVSRLFFVAPLLVLGGAHYLTAFNTDQLQALALASFKINESGAGIALVFFGFSTLLEGYLILKSAFLPRFLGALGVMGGLGWLTFLWPPLGYRVFPVVAGIGLLGSLATIIWLLGPGVNEERWKEQAAAASLSIWR
jgi:hypothetical protein